MDPQAQQFIQTESTQNPQLRNQNTNQPQSKPGNLYKYGFWGIIILVILYLPIYFYFSKPRTFWNDYSTGENITIGPLPSQAANPSSANPKLQTFSSSTFSFQYPNDMMPKTDSFSQDVKEYVSVGAMGPTQKAYAKDTECFDCWSFSVSRWDLSPKDIMTRLKEEQSFSKEECGESSATDIKEVTVDGNVGYQFESTCRGNWVYTLVYKNGFDYELIQSYGNVADYMPQVKSTIQQIFSSFKFK